MTRKRPLNKITALELYGRIRCEYSPPMRISDKELNILQGQQGANDTQWKAIMPDGSLVEPGTQGTIKCNGIIGEQGRE